MRQPTRGAVDQPYQALLVDGPRAGARVAVARLPGGGPVEMLHEVEAGGAYVLAGYPGLRGFLPYRWVTSSEWAGLRHWLRLRRHAS